MSQRNQSPSDANGTHENKSEFNICSILEAPLHCWPLTLFFHNKIEPKNGIVQQKKSTIVKKAVILLLVLVFITAKKVDAQTYPPGHYNWGHVTIGEGRQSTGGQIQRSRGRDYVPDIGFQYPSGVISGSRDQGRLQARERLKALKARNKAIREKQLKRLDKLRRKGK